MRVRTLLALSALGASIVMAAKAQTPEEFFRGRQLRMVIAAPAGGGYDEYGRAVAQYLGRYIPGHPTFIAENMPGASGTVAMNWLYAQAPRDGSVIATFNNAMPFYETVGEPGIRFKSDELSWIGSVSQTANTVCVWYTAGVKTIEDAKHKEVIMSASGAAGTTAGYPTLLNRMLGTKFKVVTGYVSSQEMNGAMERGETQGRGSVPWSSWTSVRPDWVRDHKIIPLVQVAITKDPDLPDVPRLIDLAQNEEQRQVFEFVSENSTMERPFAGPPALPRDRLQVLRRAFDVMVADPEFRAMLAKAKMDIDPHTGEQVAEIVKKTVATPRTIVEKAKAALVLGKEP